MLYSAFKKGLYVFLSNTGGMIKYIRCVALSVITLCCSLCQAITQVYDYELYPHTVYYAEPTGFPSEWVLVPTFTQSSQKALGRFEERFWGGILGSLRLVQEPFWIECMTSYGTEKLRFRDNGITGNQSRTGFDDFLIDSGANLFLDEKGKVQLSLHLITGIPLFKRVTSQEVIQPLMGSRFFNVGPAVDFTFEFIRTIPHELFATFIARLLHRFPRKYTPILPPSARYAPGNMTDLVFLLHYRYRAHNIEFGYNPTFITNQSYNFPSHKQKLPTIKFTSVYGLYSYYSRELSMAFEGLVSYTFNRAYKDVTCSFLIIWFF